MELRNLGKSNLQVSPIGLGTWQFSQAHGFHKYFWKNINPPVMDEIVKVSYENGVNWFDTAEIYGSGRSERALRDALQQIQAENVVIATKWNAFLRRAGTITKTFPKRIENLDPYPIDLYQIHVPYSISRLKTQLKKMHELFEKNLIKAIGVSNFSTSKMEKSFNVLENLGSRLVSNQVKYSIFDRSIESNGVLQKAKDLDMTIIAYSPLAQGLATGVFHKKQTKIKDIPFIRRTRIKKYIKKTSRIIDELEQMSAELNCSIAQISLSWLINQNDNSVIEY